MATHFGAVLIVASTCARGAPPMTPRGRSCLLDAGGLFLERALAAVKDSALRSAKALMAELDEKPLKQFGTGVWCSTDSSPRSSSGHFLRGARSVNTGKVLATALESLCRGA
jgi:hypothetical protein